jgi:hypothetical protein
VIGLLQCHINRELQQTGAQSRDDTSRRVLAWVITIREVLQVNALS